MNNNNLPIQLVGCEISRIGAVFNPAMARETWADVGNSLMAINACHLFLLGDWLNFGKTAYGDKYTEAKAKTGYDYITLANAAWVCSSISIDRRNEKLSFAHHKIVASLPPDEQAKYLTLAANEELTCAKLREVVRKDHGEHVGEDNGRAAKWTLGGWFQEGFSKLSEYESTMDDMERQNTKQLLKPLVEFYERL